MDRKTLLAVVLSVVIIVGGMLITPLLFPSKPAATAPTVVSSSTQGTPSPAGPAATSGTNGAAQSNAAPTSASPAATGTSTVPAAGGSGAVAATPDSSPPASQPQTIERQTDLYDLTFASAGATLTSVKLRKYKNVDGSLVDMEMLPKTAAANEIPFALSFGLHGAEELTVPFVLRESSTTAQSTFEFSRVFVSSTGVPFTLRKTYVFDKDEYLFELRISIENSVNDFPALDFNGIAYTLTLGPQIGPHYLKLDNRNDYRNYAYYESGKRQDPKVALGQMKELDKRVAWTGIVGKYFTAIAVPDATAYKLVYDSRKLVEGFDRSTISFERPALKSAKSTDVFRFYMGPMKKEILSLYNDAAKNQFGISDLHADEVVTSAIIVGWLATLMKYVLDFFVLIIPNYGIAIILLTLLTKVVFLPLTFRSSESMAKMAALNPKMAEIRAQLKDKPEKMNQAIAELYKREKVNPLSGCLPLLLQLPVFIALYNLLNSHFELRGALFIPGWIPDLSAPESIWTFPSAIPLLGTGLHLLPIIMLATQIASSRFTQPTGGSPQGGAQAKLLMYALPIVFFFILYEMPSGLVLYWTVQNILSVAQQLYINWLRAKKNGTGQGPAQPVLVGKSGRNLPGGSGPGGKNGARPVLKPGK
jgi:YidC/Oxa1 family membrane protein insertase